MMLCRRFSTVLFLLGAPALSTVLFASSIPGIENFDKVDSHVYRGAQPNDNGFKYLAQIGVKTVIDLREAGDRSKAEEKTVSADGMKYVSVPMYGLTPPTEAQIANILSLLEDTSTGPVFVHCKRGADRTGTVIAAYHIDHDHWDNATALTDARAHKMSPFQLPRQGYIRTFTARHAISPALGAPVVDASVTAEKPSKTQASVALAQ